MQPTRRTLLIGIVLLPFAALPVIAGDGWWYLWAAMLGTFAVALLFDAVGAPMRRQVTMEITAPAQIYVGERGSCDVVFGLVGAERVTLDALAELDHRFEAQPLIEVSLAGDVPTTLAIPLVPTRRGQLSIDAIWLRWRGPLGLLEFVDRRRVDAQVGVVPDIGAVRITAMKFFSRSSMAGVKAERFVGDGSEFESLRQYVRGLDARSIDWKSSARHGRLVCRQFRAERNHQIVIAIDTGHLMREPLEGVPRVDHAINRALLLGYVGLKTGDRVGMFGFSAEPEFYVEPQGGVAAFARLQATSAKIDYGTGETNFTVGIVDLASKLRRRSLIVVFTEFVDSVSAQLMIDNLDRLARRHVVLFVSLRDPELDGQERAEIDGLESVGRAVVSADLSTARRAALLRLRRLGVHVVDALPGQASVELINSYLEIKRRELV